MPLLLSSACLAPREVAAHPEVGARVEVSDVELVLSFDHPVVPGDEAPGATNDGNSQVTVSVVTSSGGRLVWTAGATEGGAVRTPSYTPTGLVRGAAIVVRPGRGAPDSLSPGTADFEFGLDLWADPAQAGREGDDGDNLIQRGRFDQTSQFKLQVDHGIPACRLAGSGGAVVVQADRGVRPERWYRLTCSRIGGTVRMDLVDLSGLEEPEHWSVVADLGELTFTDVPLSIAAKLNSTGRIDPVSADQFHGIIDQVFVDVH